MKRKKKRDGARDWKKWFWWIVVAVCVIFHFLEHFGVFYYSSFLEELGLLSILEFIDELM